MMIMVVSLAMMIVIGLADLTAGQHHFHTFLCQCECNTGFAAVTVPGFDGSNPCAVPRSETE